MWLSYFKIEMFVAVRQALYSKMAKYDVPKITRDVWKFSVGLFLVPYFVAILGYFI